MIFVEPSLDTLYKVLIICKPYHLQNLITFAERKMRWRVHLTSLDTFYKASSFTSLMFQNLLCLQNQRCSEESLKATALSAVNQITGSGPPPRPLIFRGNPSGSAVQHASQPQTPQTSQQQQRSQSSMGSVDSIISLGGLDPALRSLAPADRAPGSGDQCSNYATLKLSSTSWKWFFNESWRTMSWRMTVMYDTMSWRMTIMYDNIFMWVSYDSAWHWQLWDNVFLWVLQCPFDSMFHPKWIPRGNTHFCEYCCCRPFGTKYSAFQHLLRCATSCKCMEQSASSP